MDSFCQMKNRPIPYGLTYYSTIDPLIFFLNIECNNVNVRTYIFNIIERKKKYMNHFSTRTFSNIYEFTAIIEPLRARLSTSVNFCHFKCNGEVELLTCC